jgi:hypothetical protein
MLKQKYKFYLSFENSFCKEYLTEKVAKMMSLNIVPIVLGGSRYADYLPPHSYISVRNFSSPKKLADYLLLLDANDSLYNMYFEWKNQYKCFSHNAPCEICKALQLQQKPRTMTLLDLFWNEKKDCYTPSQYYRGIANITG